jgi:hypothetical protein
VDPTSRQLDALIVVALRGSGAGRLGSPERRNEHDGKEQERKGGPGRA